MGTYIVVTPFFPSDNSFRGAYIYDQVVAIKKTKLYDNVLVFKPKPLSQRENFYTYNGIVVHLFPFLQMPSYILNGMTNHINGLMFKNSVARLKIDINSIKIVHTHVSYFAACGIALKKMNPNIKVLVQHHDRDPFTILHGKFADKKWNIRYRAQKNIDLFNTVDYHISISHVVEDNLLAFPYPGKFENYEPYLQILKKVEDLPHISPRNSIVLYNGVDCTKFYPEHQNHLGFVVGSIGNFVSLKDHITLIKAIEQIVIRNTIPDIHLRLIGSGPLGNDYISYIKNNSLDNYISIEKEIPHEKLRDFYNSIDLFVLPSTYEGFGCVYTEAYACGVPFMACKHQGAAECISPKDEINWLIKSHDYIQLSKLIENYYKKRNKQYLCAEYDIDVLVKQFLNIINNK